jgi:hypothetical protein
MLFVVNSNEFAQLCKLPVLLHHFLDHRAKTGGLTFAGFLLQHYTRETSSDNDEQEDNRLPFKNVADHPPLPYIALQKLSVAIGFFSEATIQHSIYRGWKPFDLVYPVFHPPCHAGVAEATV